MFAAELERLDVLAKVESEIADSGQRLITMMGALVDFDVAKAKPHDLEAAAKAEAAVAEERARLEHERRLGAGRERSQPLLPSKAERSRKAPAEPQRPSVN